MLSAMSLISDLLISHDCTLMADRNVIATGIEDIASYREGEHRVFWRGHALCRKSPPGRILMSF
ncbi:uncharacterized protein RCC_01720 [Ramularia collo-cygni]|uniref:Uncharacterized protein n=1 Tax=Ramularia collo-cygni TaxID=112498 RepID=A0A2D3UM15_9PEZI|nr:uncharacterized protein RCC_01720 [Ramularia collo-cygni]CZT15882.1 uncharacterized protein RCC_01720 [Ramularia collo-cygni]